MKTLKNMSKPEGADDQVVDAGSRKSIAMRALVSLLAYNRDDNLDLVDFESHYIEGTFTWFRTQSVYTDFEAGKLPMLWISGPAGMGKSTLAYTVVKPLQEEFRGDANTSVAHFFFREEGERKFPLEMLRSCALQIAIQDSGYREEAVAEAQAYERPKGEYLGDPRLMSSGESMWELLFMARFTKKSGRRLLLVLDGLDEVEEGERNLIKRVLASVSVAEDMNIQVLFTSDPGVFDLNPEATKTKVFEMTKELMLPDIRAIIIGRIRGLSRLRKLPQRIKNKIVARISKKADSETPPHSLAPRHLVSC